MISIPQGQPGEKGTWHAAGVRNTDSRMWSVLLTCPGCGKISACYNEFNGHPLSNNHDILEDGTVQPSVVCPFPPCPFHEYIKLEGYTFGALAKSQS